MINSVRQEINHYSPFGSRFSGNISCAFSLRQHKNMSLCYADTREALGSRKIFLEPLGIDYRLLICAKQVHSSGVKVARESDAGKGALSYETSVPDTDAFVTEVKNLPLSIFTADCLSIFLYDPAKPAIGLVHAGWRSTKENIAVKTLRLMQKEFNTSMEDLYVGFGPSIRSCCYEVGEAFKDHFAKGLSKRNNRFYLDLIRVNREEVLSLGVKESNIFDPEICTFCHSEDFFSFRREKDSCGRMISVLMLK